ncbi:hypothetical protein Q2460_26140, partial [Escherichia coli]|nr:hypothetical protein [Escherichia coli]
GGGGGVVGGGGRGVRAGGARLFPLVLPTRPRGGEVFRKQRATFFSPPAGPRSASSSSASPDPLPAGT